MALKVECDVISAPDTTGAQLFSLDTGIWGSDAPQLAMVYGAPPSIGNNPNVGVATTIGFYDGTDHVSVASHSQNGAGTSNAGRRQVVDDFSNMFLTAGNVVEEGQGTGFTTTFFQTTWPLVEDSGPSYLSYYLGGSDITNISIDQYTTPTSTGNVGYTAPGFQPDFIIGLHQTSILAPPSIVGVHLAQGFGFSDGTTDANAHIFDRNNQATSDNWSVLSSNLIHIIDGANGNDLEVASVVSFDATGYTLNWSFADAAQQRYFWIISVKGPAAKVVTSTQPTTNTTNDVSAGFVPRGGIAVSAMKTTSQTATANGRFMMGTWSPDGSASRVDLCHGIMCEDGQATTDVDDFASTDGTIKHYDHTQTLKGKATVTVQGNGIRETWTSVDGTQREHAWLLLGDTPPPTTTTTTTTLPPPSTACSHVCVNSLMMPSFFDLG